MRPASIVSLPSTLSETTNRSSFLSAARIGGSARQRGRRIGRHHPQRLDLAALDRLEHLHGLEAFALGHVRRVPEPAHAVDIVAAQNSYVRRAGSPDRRPPARPSRWAGRSATAGPMPGLPIRPVARWQLMMALTLSVPCADWFTPCEIAGDRARLRREQLEELRDIGFLEAGRGGGCSDIRGDLAGALQRFGKACGVALMKASSSSAGVRQMHQQAAEQRRVGARRNR